MSEALRVMETPVVVTVVEDLELRLKMLEARTRDLYDRIARLEAGRGD